MEYLKTVQDTSLAAAFLEKHPSIEFIRYQWQDFAAIYRQRILTRSYCRSLINSGKHYGIGPKAMLSTVSDAGVGQYIKQERIQLRPDWASLRICHFAPNHATVMCFAYCEEAKEPFFQCPCFALAKVLERCSNEFDLHFRIGFEVEFVLLDSKLQPLEGPDEVWMWSAMSGLRDSKLRIIEEVVHALKQSDIPVLHFHTENRHQLELVTGDFAPMEAIDALLYTHELLKCVALRYGMCASVAPRPIIGGPANAVHLHFSTDKADLSDYVLAGVLAQLSVICAFGMGSYDSYSRVQADGCLAGIWVAWGTENRFVAVRKIEHSHWELKTVDSTANLYLVTAMLLNAALEGIQAKYKTNIEDIRVCPLALPLEEREAMGLTGFLPASLDEAILLVRDSDMADRVLGSEMKRLYVNLKEQECGMKDMSKDERRLQYLRFF